MANKETDGKTVIKISDPGDMFAYLEYMFGFRPRDSIVLMADAERGKQVGRRLRGDLPPEEAVDDVAAQLISAIAVDGPTSVLLLVVGGGTSQGHPPPHASLVAALRRELETRRIAQHAAFWVAEIAEGARWSCYDHAECGGEVPDPKGTVAAAEYAGRGYVSYDSRHELEELFRPDSELLLNLRADRIDRRMAATRDATRQDRVSEGVRAIRAGLKVARSGVLGLGDDEIVAIAVALSEPEVRDACLATALPPDGDVAGAAERLWQTLARAIPAPERADAACLAGYAAYMRGDGVLASIAFEAALDADPGHVLSGLLNRALQYGMEPQRLHGLAEHDEFGLSAEPSAAA